MRTIFVFSISVLFGYQIRQLTSTQEARLTTKPKVIKWQEDLIIGNNLNKNSGVDHYKKWFDNLCLHNNENFKVIDRKIADEPNMDVAFQIIMSTDRLIRPKLLQKYLDNIEADKISISVKVFHKYFLKENGNPIGSAFEKQLARWIDFDYHTMAPWTTYAGIGDATMLRALLRSEHQWRIVGDHFTGKHVAKRDFSFLRAVARRYATAAPDQFESWHQKLSDSNAAAEAKASFFDVMKNP